MCSMCRFFFGIRRAKIRNIVPSVLSLIIVDVVVVYLLYVASYVVVDKQIHRNIGLKLRFHGVCVSIEI